MSKYGNPNSKLPWRCDEIVSDFKFVPTCITRKKNSQLPEKEIYLAFPSQKYLVVFRVWTTFPNKTGITDAPLIDPI